MSARQHLDRIQSIGQGLTMGRQSNDSSEVVEARSHRIVSESSDAGVGDRVLITILRSSVLI